MRQLLAPPVKLFRAAFHTVVHTASHVISRTVRRNSTQDREPSAERAERAERADVAGSDEPVDMLPYPVLEEPVPVVERALAAEADDDYRGAGAGGTTEPRGSSRSEEHGEVSMQRVERDEIDQETAPDNQ